MKFLCLICADTMMEHMSEVAAAKHYADYRAFIEEIKDGIEGYIELLKRCTFKEISLSMAGNNGN